MAENNAIQNFSSMINGPQAVGPCAHAEQTVEVPAAAAATTGPPAPSPDAAALAEAVDALRAELARLRAQRPRSVPDVDAATAEVALLDIKEIAAGPAPDRRVLRRRIRTVIDALGEVSALTTTLTVLEAAVRKLIGLS
jgi:hypothetical protein